MKKRTYYLICMGVILVIALIMSVKGGLFSAGERAEIFRILSDSFFVPGVLFVGAGALSWGASKGTYDMLSYGCGRMARQSAPGTAKQKYSRHYRNKQQRDEGGRGWKPHVLLSGLIALLIAGVFMALYFL